MSDKTCTKCGISRDVDLFVKDKTRQDGRFPQCKMCRKTYFQSEHGKLVHREGNARYSKTPKGKLTSYRTQKRYQQTEGGRLMYQQAARRRLARKFDVDMQLSKADIAFIYHKFDSMCFLCHAVDHLEIDHHYPLSAGFGLNTKNAVLLCRSCNASKSDKSPNKFYSKEQLSKLSVLLN